MQSAGAAPLRVTPAHRRKQSNGQIIVLIRKLIEEYKAEHGEITFKPQH